MTGHSSRDSMIRCTSRKALSRHYTADLDTFQKQSETFAHFGHDVALRKRINGSTLSRVPKAECVGNMTSQKARTEDWKLPSKNLRKLLFIVIFCTATFLFAAILKDIVEYILKSQK